MRELLGQLGIDWKLLLSQGVNFFILLIALTFLVWRPLVALIKQRQAFIEQGLKDAKLAKERLMKADQEAEQRLVRANEEALARIIRSDQEAMERTEKITKRAEEKVELMLKEADSILKQRKEEELEDVVRVAEGIIKEAIVETVRLQPAMVDDALIAQALKNISRGRI